MNIDVLKVNSNLQNFYEVIAIVPMNSYINDNYDLIKASQISLRIIDDALKSGKKVLIPKNIQYSEVKPNDICIQDNLSEFELVKNAAKNYIITMMNENVTKVNILNIIDYMQCYMKLMNEGICITDENREDKYFQIIEAAQSIEEPQTLDENSTFEQQYEYPFVAFNPITSFICSIRTQFISLFRDVNG